MNKFFLTGLWVSRGSRRLDVKSDLGILLWNCSRDIKTMDTKMHDDFVRPTTILKML
jgi:hypothetical protein